MSKPPQLEDSWDILTRQLEAFLEAWESRGGQPPALADFLPDSGAIRTLVLIELIKADIDYRLRQQLDKPLEEYAAEHAELGSVDALPGDLIYEEIHLRKSHGQSVRTSDYYERFPKQADELRSLLELETFEATSTLYAARPESLEVGEKVGDFHLLVKLGKGAFASVYLARQESLQRMVALKVSADRGSETRTLAQLDHPNIVRVYDQLTLPEKSLRLMYMEYAPGGTLHEVVARAREITVPEERSGAIVLDAVADSLRNAGLMDPPQDSVIEREMSWPETVCRIGIELARALDHAHRQGILHRDIKPANVLLGANARPKLADFNISFCSTVKGSAPAAYFGGSLAYMSPEQLRACNPRDGTTADELDHRSDLYSLAVMLWELLHAQRPFLDRPADGDWTNMLDGMTEHRSAGAPRPASGGDPLSGQLQAVLARCLAPRPEDRIQSGAELAGELHMCLEPRARKLIRPQNGRLRQLALRQPIAAILAAVVLPNAIAAAANWLYNYGWIDKNAKHAEDTWKIAQLVINLTAFPLGILLLALVVLPTARVLRRQQRGEEVPLEMLNEARRRALGVGHWSAWIGVALWALAGIAYPVSINYSLSGSFPKEAYPVFLSDLISCGLIAAAYPFFGTTMIVIRVFYSRLLDLSRVPKDEQGRLNRLAQRAGIYLLIAAGSPIIAIIALMSLLLAGDEVQDFNKIALLVLAVAGVVGLFAAYWAHRQLQKDLAALCYALQSTALT